MTGEKWFVLAIDHRSSFRQWSAESTGAAVPATTLSNLKLVVADATVEAAASLMPGEAALLVDDEYGTAAIARAGAAGVTVVVPAERSGLSEFEFEHGDQFAEAILRSGADAVKALVRYNPSFDQDRNARSRRRLVQLARWCEETAFPLMLELLVPPVEWDLDAAGRPLANFDSERRPALTCAAIEELRHAGLHPKWWKLEGQADRQAFAEVASATGAGTAGSDTACLLLGRGARDEELARWIRDAAATAGFAGFAVGRSLWVDALGGVLAGTMDEKAAARQISDSYLGLVALYEEAAEARLGCGKSEVQQ